MENRFPASFAYIGDNREVVFPPNLHALSPISGRCVKHCVNEKNLISLTT